MTLELDLSSLCETDNESTDASICEDTPGSTQAETKGKINFINSRIVSALDKCKISDRSAMHVIVPIAEALGHNINDLIINRSTLQRQRELKRKQKAMEIKTAFKVC